MKTQILIIGGGIAGLWLLAELKQKGYQVLLLEKEAIGNGQTIASQGIIHGGTKYALTGKITGAAQTIKEMPRIWGNALSGNQIPDLQSVKILSRNQYLWTSGEMSSKLTTFFASKVMQNRMGKLAAKDYPSIFNSSDYKGMVYRLEESILDMPSLLAVFYDQLKSHLIHISKLELNSVSSNSFSAFARTVEEKEIEINAEQIICTAGSGNEKLAKYLGAMAPKMQRRPLQMIMLRGDLPELYGHALGMSALPKATITAHLDEKGRRVWYVGGQPAEKGVGKSRAELIENTKKELKKLLPWVNFENTEWATFPIDRAENLQPLGGRPDKPFFKVVGNVCMAWPTKLAFAPLLSSQIQAWIKDKGIEPSNKSMDFSAQAPPIATALWNRKDIKWS